jgi:FAD/FMN-containing dehydrogenase/Fe-S oxidoreductase
MLFEVLGDIWVVNRNPYLQDDLLENQKRRQKLIDAMRHRLKQVETRLNGNERARDLMNMVADAVTAFDQALDAQQQLRQQVLKRLSKVTHPDNIDFSGIARVSHATDATDWRVELPLAVISPDSEAEVLDIVKGCIALELPMIPRGGGTGYTGGAIPLDSRAVVINTEKLEFLSSVEYLALPGVAGEKVATVRAGAGVVTRRVADLAERHGLIFAVDPTSIDASTIGGNISMNAGGKKAVRWGTTLDNLVSWKMVTPRGTWLEITRHHHNLGKIHEQEMVVFIAQEISADGVTPLGDPRKIEMPGAMLRKDGLGKDVTDKFLSGLPGIQKEGCDGLITSARFVLYPDSKYTRTLCIEFFGADLSLAVPAIDEITQFMDETAKTGVLLTGLEHLDERYIKAVKYATKANRRQRPKMILLADIVSNDEAALVAVCNRVIAMAAARGAETFMATSPEARKRFWLDRSRTAAISAHTNAFKINEDVVIPIPRLNDYNRGIERLNIEQSIKNKIQTLDLCAEFLTERADKLVASEEISDQDDAQAFWLGEQGKKAQALAHIAQVRARWQGLLDNMDEPINQHTELLLAEDMPLAAREEPLFEALLRRELVVSYRREMADKMKKLFAGHEYDAVWQKLQVIHARQRNLRLFVATHMHAGDGNVHTNIPVHSSDYGMIQEADRLVDRIMELAKSLDGVISGEHGIGLTKMQYLELDKVEAFAAYKKKVDPQGWFNRGKLMAGSGLHNAYTPSLDLVKQEALILEASELDALNDDIKDCLRCGKCKPVCQTHIPRANILYSPRNKILATGMMIEAFLYEEQTRRGVSVHHFDAMNDVSDHCTVCHHCAKPCPVNIDFGDVTMRMRKILTEKGQKRTAWAAKAAFLYLNSKNPFPVRLMRKTLIGWASTAQKLGHYTFKTLGLLGKASDIPRSTNKPQPVVQQVVHFVRKPLDTGGNLPPMRALLDLEDPSYIPIIRANNRVTEESEAVFYFPGCGSERLFNKISMATLAMVSEAGAQTILPPGYLCCGYPQTAAGNAAKGTQITTENRALFHRVANTLNYLDIKTVLVSCGTCLDQLMKYEFEQIFPGCRIMDIHEYLMEKGLKLNQATGVQYMYHDPCHSPMKIHNPLKVASTLMATEVIDSDRCCGEAGTMAVSRPDIATQLRFRKEEEILLGVKDLTGKAGKADKGKVKMLTACPACQQGLNRYADSTGVDTDYIVVEMAANWLGANWQDDFIKRIQNGGVEKVLL